MCIRDRCRGGYYEDDSTSIKEPTYLGNTTLEASNTGKGIPATYSERVKNDLSRGLSIGEVQQRAVNLLREDERRKIASPIREAVTNQPEEVNASNSDEGELEELRKPGGKEESSYEQALRWEPLLEWDIKYGEYDSWDTYFDNSGRRWLRLELSLIHI